jgi:hypothetical protein
MNKAEEGAKEFTPLDPGQYAFVIKDAAKVGQTSKENPKFTINPSVESGPRQNARVFHDFNVSERPYAMKNFFFGDLAILGLDASFFDTNPTEQQIAQALQGQIASQAPYWFDITGYLYVQQYVDANGVMVDGRSLLIGNHPNYEAKSRVPDLPTVLDSPNISILLDSIFGPDETAAPVAVQAAPVAQQQAAPAAAGQPEPPSL